MCVSRSASVQPAHGVGLLRSSARASFTICTDCCTARALQAMIWSITSPRPHLYQYVYAYYRRIHIIFATLLSCDVMTAPPDGRRDLAAMMWPLARGLVGAEEPILAAHGITMWGYIVLN